MIGKVGDLFRWTCMCGHDDRVCTHCGHPFASNNHLCIENRKDAAQGADVIHCPKCGQPHVGMQGKAAIGVAADARVRAGLIK